MNRFVLSIIALSALSLATACGGGSEDLTKSEAGKVQAAVYGSAMTISTSAQAGIAQAQASKADSISVNGTDYTYEITTNGVSFQFTATSAEGGTASVTGEGSFEDGAYAYELTINYSAFTAEGISLTGDITMSFSGDGAQYSFSLSGTVEASGKVVGTADLDLEVTASQTGATVKGTVAGYAIDQTINYGDYSNYY